MLRAQTSTVLRFWAGLWRTTVPGVPTRAGRPVYAHEVRQDRAPVLDELHVFGNHILFHRLRGSVERADSRRLDGQRCALVKKGGRICCAAPVQSAFLCR